MEWISVEDRLPEDGTDCLIAILSRFENASARFLVRTATYKENSHYHWEGDRCHSVEAPTHWIPFPQAPAISYKNDPAECDHQWHENPRKNPPNRYCKLCNTVQKEKKREWECGVA